MKEPVKRNAAAKAGGKLPDSLAYLRLYATRSFIDQQLRTAHLWMPRISLDSIAKTDAREVYKTLHKRKKMTEEALKKMKRPKKEKAPSAIENLHKVKNAQEILSFFGVLAAIQADQLQGSCTDMTVDTVNNSYYEHKIYDDGIDEDSTTNNQFWGGWDSYTRQQLGLTAATHWYDLGMHRFNLLESHIIYTYQLPPVPCRAKYVWSTVLKYWANINVHTTDAESKMLEASYDIATEPNGLGTAGLNFIYDDVSDDNFIGRIHDRGEELHWEKFVTGSFDLPANTSPAIHIAFATSLLCAGGTLTNLGGAAAYDPDYYYSDNPPHIRYSDHPGVKYYIYPEDFDIEEAWGDPDCFISTAICRTLAKTDNCYELKLLRAFRDLHVRNLSTGPTLIEEYYRVAPGIVGKIGQRTDSERIWDMLYRNYLKKSIRFIEQGQYDEALLKYREMIRFCRLLVLNGEKI